MEINFKIPKLTATQLSSCKRCAEHANRAAGSLVLARQLGANVDTELEYAQSLVKTVDGLLELTQQAKDDAAFVDG